MPASCAATAARIFAQFGRSDEPLTGPADVAEAVWRAANDPS